MNQCQCFLCKIPIYPELDPPFPDGVIAKELYYLCKTVHSHGEKILPSQSILKERGIIDMPFILRFFSNLRISHKMIVTFGLALTK